MSTASRLPEPTRERWQPLRSGLLNLFRYDYEELLWEQGHLLLRGNNGTGKSRILALQLPFLLDGEVAPSRLEPDGDPAKRIEWNLLLDKYADRLGYTWLELGRRTAEGEPRFLTLGCGLQAAEGRGLVGKWFFITRQRVGRDLFLQSATGQALTRERLAEAIGAEGEVFTTATAYRKEVDARLFKLGEQRYDALIKLLIELRKPQLARALDEKSLSDALSEALAPPAQAILADVADAFRSLETDRAHLESFRAARDATLTFLVRYRRYAQIAARRRAERVRSAHAEYEAIQRKLRISEQELEEAQLARREAEQEIERLGIEQSKAQAEVETLSASPAMRSAEALERARKEAEARQRESAAAGQDLDQAKAERGRAERRLELAREQAAKTREALVAAEARAAEAAKQCGLADAHRAALEPLGLPEAREPKAAEAALRRVETSAQKRLEAGRHLARRNRAVEDALRELEHARQAKAEAEAARDREAERERDARRGLEQARDGLAEAYRLWSEAARELRPASIEALAEALVGWCERAEGVSPVQAAVAEAERAAAEGLASLRAESQRRLRERESALAELRAERDRLLAGEHRPPPAPHTRDEGRRAERAGAPLWRLCDFSAELTATERAGLESALESAGLLDAWVTPEGRLLDREERDVAVAVGTSPLPPEDRHLGLVLVPAVNRDDARCAAVSDETVRAVLRQIGWGEGAGTAWVAADGRWQLGPMHGAWSKAEAEHIGEGAREASRRQRLRALEPLIADAERALGAARRELESIASREQAAREEARRAPADDGVRRAVAELGAVARAVAQARQRLALAEEKVAERRARHAEAVSERDRDAKDLGVEAWVDDPRGLEDAVRGYQNALAGLRPRFEGHLAALEQACVAEEAARGAAQAEARREQAALGARQRLAAAVQARDTLEQTVGAEAREVIARLQQARRRIAGLRGSEDEAKRRERELYGRTQRAEARIGEHRESLARQSEARDVALQALARFAGTGLFAVAHTELSEIEPGPWSASRGVEIARRIEQRLSSVESDDEAWKRNQSEIQRHVQTLISALGAQQLQPGYELVDELLVVSAVFQGQTRTMAQLAEDLNAEVTSRQTLLSARERELIENHLIGEVATHLHERMRAAEALVRAMNEELEARPTSTGMKLKFVWEPREDERPGLAEARKRLLRTTATWTAAEREAVGAFLQREIARVRTEDEAGTWQEHLARALDYRAWHRFSVERFQDGRWKKLTRRTHGTGSGGEKAIALTVPKFAAAAAHYKSADPCAPRLILLDEAFVGVDSDMRAKSMGLLHAFDLDFLMTSEREWGCYATLPGLAIYQLATRPGIDAVGVTRWLWNGRERAHVEHVVCPAAPPQGERAEAR